MASTVPSQLASLEKEVRDTFKLLSSGFQRLDKTKDVGRQSKQLEDLTAKMREAKRMIREFDREIKEDEGRAPPETTKLLNEKKQSLIKELNPYVALRKTYTRSFGSKQELLDGGPLVEPSCDTDVSAATNTTNQAVAETGKKQMGDKDHESIKMPKQMGQLGSSINEVETSKYSLKKTFRQIATDRCVLFILFLIIVGIIALIVVMLVHPDSDDIVVPSPPAARRLLMKSEFDFN